MIGPYFAIVYFVDPKVTQTDIKRDVDGTWFDSRGELGHCGCHCNAWFKQASKSTSWREGNHDKPLKKTSAPCLEETDEQFGLYPDYDFITFRLHLKDSGR